MWHRQAERLSGFTIDYHVSKEYAHRELRRMIGGDVQPEQRANDFSNYTDAELFAELARLANELGIKTTLTVEPKDG